jgi:hypothetical protein
VGIFWKQNIEIGTTLLRVAYNILRTESVKIQFSNFCPISTQSRKYTARLGDRVMETSYLKRVEPRSAS